ncbi:MAG: ATP-binding cassette domain-containing protein, partial [Chitinivibrionales bacterium]|nr:ATP-binding cassette domain-containing protein [Chitinivibrionales bacterium]
MDTPVVSTTDLRKRFGAHRVLCGVDLHIEHGSLFGLVGLNGAGKTTLIRLLLGLLKPESGDVRVAGKAPWRHESSMYRAIGAVLEHDGFWGNLSFAQNIRVFADARGVSRGETDEYLRRYWSGSDILESTRKVRTFSRGQRTQCALCRAFLGWPPVCLLDEPTVGLDIDSYDRFHRLVREARERGAAVLVSSHQLETIEELCDRVGLLRGG